MPRPAVTLVQVVDNAVSVHASYFFDIIRGAAYRCKLPNLVADELANDRTIQPLPAFAGDDSQPAHLRLIFRAVDVALEWRLHALRLRLAHFYSLFFQYNFATSYRFDAQQNRLHFLFSLPDILKQDFLVSFPVFNFARNIRAGHGLFQAIHLPDVP